MESYETLSFKGEKEVNGPEGSFVIVEGPDGTKYKMVREALQSLIEETQPTKPHGAFGLETFPAPSDLQVIEFKTREFTCLCPKTGQPDFATLVIRYIPHELCVESKSLKLYFWSYRDKGAFHEKVTRDILTDLAERLQPRWIQVFADFDIRGGLHESVSLEYTRPADVDPEGLERLILANRIRFLAKDKNDDSASSDGSDHPRGRGPSRCL